jgi:hypothetical protein
MGVSFVIRDNNNVVAFDEQMVRLAMENAISNAIVHGDGSPIVLGATFDDQLNMIAMYVENQVSESSNITSDKLAEVCERARSNDRSLQFTPSVEVMPPNPAGFTDTSTDQKLTDVFAATKMNLSTRSGLRHIDVACGGAGGYFDLHLKQSPNKCVVLTCYFPAKVVPNDDDNMLSTTIEHSLSGLVSGDISGNPSHNLCDMPSQLKVCAIDDSELICKGYQKLLLASLRADLDNSVVCCPKTKAEVEIFVNHVMNCDICILDQHIELNGSSNVGFFFFFFFFLFSAH